VTANSANNWRVAIDEKTCSGAAGGWLGADMAAFLVNPAYAATLFQH
jgi:hypothetical protein